MGLLPFETQRQRWAESGGQSVEPGVKVLIEENYPVFREI